MGLGACVVRVCAAGVALGWLLACSGAASGGGDPQLGAADPGIPGVTPQGATVGMQPAGSSATPAPVGRQLTFNGAPARPQDLAALAQYEQAWGVQIPDGAYWYDDRSGAAGLWGGPTRGFLRPGLGLGGAATPANASGGGSGTLTGVFINGRELHPLDVAGLTKMFGAPPWPGRWWVDGQGNFGFEGQGMLGNLFALAAQARGGRGGGGGGNPYYTSDVASGSSTFVGSGCAAVSARLSPGDRDSEYSYYVGCE